VFNIGIFGLKAKKKSRKIYRNSILDFFRPGGKGAPKFYFNAFRIEKTDWIKIVPVGYFPEHPDGAHEVTKEHIQEMANNIKNGGTDILFDYGHESLWFMGARAAGWSPKDDVEARDDGLYIRYPTFTPNAQAAIDAGEYRYFSPAYRLNATDKQGKEIGAILHSVALTNRPYMDLEIDHIKNAEVTTMPFPKKILDKLGLPEDATEEQVEQKIDELAAANEVDESGEGGEEVPESTETANESGEATVANSTLESSELQRWKRNCKPPKKRKQNC